MTVADEAIINALRAIRDKQPVTSEVLEDPTMRGLYVTEGDTWSTLPVGLTDAGELALALAKERDLLRLEVAWLRAEDRSRRVDEECKQKVESTISGRVVQVAMARMDRFRKKAAEARAAFVAAGGKVES